MVIHVMVNWQLSKRGIGWPVSQLTVSRAKVQQLIEVMCFKAIHGPVFGFNWSQAQVRNEKAIIL